VAEVSPNDVFRVECLDCTGGQIKDNDSAEDIKNADLTQTHCLSGPVSVKGAEPGDLLVVDILDIGALRDSEWGFTGIFAQSNGGGFLTEHYPEAAKAIWKFEGIYATSRHIPGVRFAGIMHPGLIGCAPSHDLLKEWNDREKRLADSDPHKVLALLPVAKGALLGKVKEGEEWDRVVKEAARTIPPRENGGNCDIKNLSKGSRVYFPVYIPGANLSMGDIHFSQGDGEISFCGAIEMAGFLDLKVSLIKGGVKMYKTLNPIFMPGPLGPHYSSFLIFEGISVDEKGNQLYLDATVAYRQACLNAIRYLSTFGYTEEQVYLLLSAAPVEGRISGIVDVPNACCTVAIPTQLSIIR